MKCKEIHKKLIFFLEGDLPGDELQQISSHLSRCEECRSFAEEMKKILAVVQEEVPVEVSPYFYSRLKARMENRAEEERQVTSFSIMQKFLQPALFSVLLLAGIYTGILMGRQATSGMPSPEKDRNELVPFIDEMKSEPLESFLME